MQQLSDVTCSSSSSTTGTSLLFSFLFTQIITCCKYTKTMKRALLSIRGSCIFRLFSLKKCCVFDTLYIDQKVYTANNSNNNTVVRDITKASAYWCAQQSEANWLYIARIVGSWDRWIGMKKKGDSQEPTLKWEDKFNDKLLLGLLLLLLLQYLSIKLVFCVARDEQANAGK